MKQQDILAAKSIIRTSEEIVRKIAKKIDLSPSSVYSMVCQYQYEDGYFGYEEGEKEEVELIYNDFHFRHNQAGIRVFGVGCYRIVFSFQGKAMKVPIYGNENDQELEAWKCNKKKVDKDFLLPILDSFTIEDKTILLFPVIDMTMDYYEFNSYYSYTNDEDMDLEEVLSRIPKYKKEEFIRFLLIYDGMNDSHEGNYGYYNGKLVSIDYASFYGGIGKNRKLLNLLKKEKV